MGVWEVDVGFVEEVYCWWGMEKEGEVIDGVDYLWEDYGGEREVVGI